MATTDVAPPIHTDPNDKANGSLGGGQLSEKTTQHLESSQASLSKDEITNDATGPRKTLFPQPTESSKPAVQSKLTAEQKEKYEKLLDVANSWTDIADSSDKSTRSITDLERMWLSRECLLRYLRASKWVVATAATRLQATLSWRREWGIQQHNADYISEENATGKQVIIGFDKEGRPCLYLNPHRQNTKGKEKQMHHLVFMLERCIDLMPPGQESLALLVNFSHTRQGQGASPAQGIQTIQILQNHYPERLGISIVQEVPWYIKLFFKAINPFIDPVTRDKLKFDWDLKLLIPPEQLLKEFGGDVDFEYEHDVYWPAFNDLANANRSKMIANWREGGKKVGESEAYMKGLEKAVVAGDLKDVATEGEIRSLEKEAAG